MLFCKPKVHHQVSKTNLSCLSLQSFPEFSLFLCWKFQLAHLSEDDKPSSYVFDTISSHEFVKHLIFKMASSITNDSSGCPKSVENVSL